MTNQNILNFVKQVIEHAPSDWLKLTTHRLDIYNEGLAKVEFLDHLESLLKNNSVSETALQELPTAFDYIRLGHPLSCLLEWTLAKQQSIDEKNVISFSSMTMPIYAILRKNKLDNINTRLIYRSELPECFDTELLQQVYGYEFDCINLSTVNQLPAFNGITIYINQGKKITSRSQSTEFDFIIQVIKDQGSIVFINHKNANEYSAAIQHVRRRETIAMTPHDCLAILQQLTNTRTDEQSFSSNHEAVYRSIQEINGVKTQPILSSSGLSMQYAILMGLIDDAKTKHPNKDIKIVVPPNCYGGTNDQSRRIAAAIENVEVVDLPVDGDHDMVQSVELVLSQLAKVDAIPFIIAEIPTNPRVEVPDLQLLSQALQKSRTTPTGEAAIVPVFILDQTFCPNVHFLGDDDILAEVKTIAYVSGSKFPSGGLCTAGYAIANTKADYLMHIIEQHLELCDNSATNKQIELLEQQIPSMLSRIQSAYQNTRAFVNHIQAALPAAKINFVSEELAAHGFTPSVFSLDLPAPGNTEVEKEKNKQELNHKLIELMIQELPDEAKHCVSYGQLKGSYWTIPATSTQGTTKEKDKDYIVRVSIAPDMDIEKHKTVFSHFVQSI